MIEIGFGVELGQIGLDFNKLSIDDGSIYNLYR